MRAGLAAAALTGGLLACALASAQERGLYLGGALGQSTFKIWCNNSDPAIVVSACDDKDIGWKLFGGYQVNRYFGAELSYVDWGKVSGSGATGGVPFNAQAETTGIGIALVGSFPLGPAFSVFAKVGYLQTEQERGGRKFDDDEYFRGFGLRYRLAGNWVVRGEWEKANFLKAELLSIGVEYRF